MVLWDGEIMLRPLATEDATFYIALANHSEIRERVNNTIPYTQIEFDELWRLRQSDAGYTTWIVCANDIPCGVVNIAALRDARQLQGGYWIDPDFAGHGIMTTAWRLVVEHLFHARDVERIQALVEPDNVASLRLLEKCGFTREGLLRRYYPSRYRGLLDVYMYAKIKE